MAIRSPDNVKPSIDTRGSDGNAFVLMGYARKYARQLDLDGDQILHEMRSGSYQDLLNTFDKYFGDYVDLVVDENH
jgi:hypothetical protein